MAGKIPAKDGDCVASIATKNGFPWSKIFDHGENASLKQLRKNSNVLMPGDQVYLPDKKKKTVDAGTNSVHKFKVKGLLLRLRIKLLDSDGKGLGGKKWTLKAAGKELSGTTPGDGLLDTPVPPDATTGELSITLEDGKPPVVWQVAIGSLNPASETKGVQQRLRNLGFECGKPDGTTGASTKEALQAFQKKNGLTAKGELDDPTREKALSSHGV